MKGLGALYARVQAFGKCSNEKKLHCCDRSPNPISKHKQGWPQRFAAAINACLKYLEAYVFCRRSYSGDLIARCEENNFYELS